MASQLEATSSILQLDEKESTCVTYMNTCNNLQRAKRRVHHQMIPKNKFSSYHYGVTCCGSSCCGHLPWNEHLTKGCGDNSKFYHLKLGWLDFVPSGFANLCAPVGATIIGDGILYPNKLVDMSILLTSIRTRGRNLCNTRWKVRNHFLMRL